MDAVGDFSPPDRRQEKFKMRKQQRQREAVREQIREMQKWRYPSHSSFIVDLNDDYGQQDDFELVDLQNSQAPEKLPTPPPAVAKIEKPKPFAQPMEQNSGLKSSDGCLRRYGLWILAAVVIVLMAIFYSFLVAKVLHLEQGYQDLVNRLNETLDCEFESNFTLYDSE